MLDSDDEDDLEHRDLLRRMSTLPDVEEEWEAGVIDRAHARALKSRQSTTSGSSMGESSKTVLSMVNDANKRALEGENHQVLSFLLMKPDDKKFLPLPEDKLWEISCEVRRFYIYFFVRQCICNR